MKSPLRYLLASFFISSFFFTFGTAQAQTSLNARLTPYLSQYNLPAIAAAVIKGGKIVSAGTVGTRRAGSNIPVTLNDRFHLGSDTKAMTALLAAMLVEEGKLRWNTTLKEVFPELVQKMAPALSEVTLEQLLSHTSGIPTDNEDIYKMYSEAMAQDGNLDEMRYWLVHQWSRQPLESTPGAKFAYSNTGYIFIGAIIERSTGKTWDELIFERIFSPLKLRAAGLGPQASLGKIDAPLGHSLMNEKTKPLLAGPNGDGPAIVGPAGIAHMSILDFARWAGWNAGQGKRKPALVKPGTLRKLHTPVISMPERKDAAPGTPPGGKYALGWGELAMDWAPYPLLYHGGSNGMNLAHIWLDIKEDAAIVITANISGQQANQAFFKLAGDLYTGFVQKGKKGKRKK